MSFHREIGMPVQLLSAAERACANRFPSSITDEDLITFLKLSEERPESVLRLGERLALHQ